METYFFVIAWGFRRDGWHGDEVGWWFVKLWRAMSRMGMRAPGSQPSVALFDWPIRGPGWGPDDQSEGPDELEHRGPVREPGDDGAQQGPLIGHPDPVRPSDWSLTWKKWDGRGQKDDRGRGSDPDLPGFWWNNPDRAGQFVKKLLFKEILLSLFASFFPSWCFKSLMLTFGRFGFLFCLNEFSLLFTRSYRLKTAVFVEKLLKMSQKMLFYDNVNK